MFANARELSADTIYSSNHTIAHTLPSVAGLLENQSYATTATAAGTTTLTSLSSRQQYFTGTTTQTLVLPVTSTLSLGQSFVVTNNSTGIVTVQSSGANTILAMSYGGSAIFTVILTSGTGTASWNAQNLAPGSLRTPTVTKYLTGSGTYTTPANVAYVEIEMVGQGGGGSSGAGSTGTGNGGTAGSDSTFGPMTAGGGGGGRADGPNNANGGAGGTASLGSGPIGIALTGGGGGGTPVYNAASSALDIGGGIGGSSALGGAGQANGNGGGNGSAGAANTGGGGSGGTVNVALGMTAGAGGGSGGYIKAIINNPAATYSYSVGTAGGTGGATTGSGSGVGGAGGSGVIIITEFYYNTSSVVGALMTPTVQKFTAGSGQTYTTPANVAYIIVEAVGPGGGGGGGGASGTAATAGSRTTTFGSVITSNPGGAGAGGISGGATGPDGGNATISAPAITINALQGGGGSGANNNAGVATYIQGGPGGSNKMGSGGKGGAAGGGIGGSGMPDTGAGGGGGGAGTASGSSGTGGGAGGYALALIVNPSATYSVNVGTGGAFGTGSGGGNGGDGGNGSVTVTEYYLNASLASLSGGFVSPTVSRATTGSHSGGFSANATGTYTTPTGVSYIRVRGVGGGGGGTAGGSGGLSGSVGNATTFGTSLLNGGAGGTGVSGTSSGAGGTATVTSPAIGAPLVGSAGIGSSYQAATASTVYIPGGNGGNSPFYSGGGAGGIAGTNNAAAGTANSGGGGGGGATNGGTPSYSGAGGGSGGAFDAIIIPTAGQTFSYTVGAGGAGGGAGGGNGFAGAAGADGNLEVTEYYNNGAIGTATNVTGIVALANGGSGLNESTGYVAKTANYTAVVGTDRFIAVDSSGGSFTITLPTAVGNTGAEFTISSVGAGGGLVTLNTTSSQTISSIASGTIKLAAYAAGQQDRITVYSDGTNWKIRDSNIVVTVRASSGNTSIPGSITTCVFSNEEYDRYSVYNNATGIFTAPYAMRVKVFGSLSYSSISIGVGGVQSVYTTKNASAIVGMVTFWSSGTYAIGQPFMGEYEMAAGDTLKVQAYNNTTTALDNSGNNWVVFEQVGAL